MESETKPVNAPNYEQISMKCRNGRGCDSITAEIIVIPGQEAQRLYRCVKCKHTWGLNVGGSVNL